jgi:hypothetical protein
MVHIGIERAGGVVAADPDWEKAFSRAITCVAERLIPTDGQIDVSP